MTKINTELLEDNHSKVLAETLASSNNKFLYEFLVCKENKVLHEFAKLFNLSPMELISKNKSSKICGIRQLYCKLRYEVHGQSSIEIANEIGRAPSTVRRGVECINNLIYIGDKETIRKWNKVKNIKKSYEDLPALALA